MPGTSGGGQSAPFFHDKPINTKKANERFMLHLPLKCWDTRTRTKNDRTRICSVTITPYPNIVRFGIAYPFACAKVAIFHKPTKFFDVFLP